MVDNLNEIKQREIINIMRDCGYAMSDSHIDRGGFGHCYGISYMSMNAFIAKDWLKFLARLTFIRENKNKIIAAFNDDTTKFDHEIIGKDGTIFKKYEIQAFFDGISLMQSPNTYRKLLIEENNNNVYIRQGSNKAAHIIQAGNSEKETTNPESKNILAATHSISDILDSKTSFANLLKQHGEKQAKNFSIIITMNGHATSLHCNPKKKQWYRLDPNHMPGELVPFGNEASLVTDILKSHSCKSRHSASLNFYTSESNLNEFKETYDDIHFSNSTNPYKSKNILIKKIEERLRSKDKLSNEELDNIKNIFLNVKYDLPALIKYLIDNKCYKLLSDACSINNVFQISKENPQAISQEMMPTSKQTAFEYALEKGDTEAIKILMKSTSDIPFLKANIQNDGKHHLIDHKKPDRIVLSQLIKMYGIDLKMDSEKTLWQNYLHNSDFSGIELFIINASPEDQLLKKIEEHHPHLWIGFIKHVGEISSGDTIKTLLKISPSLFDHVDKNILVDRMIETRDTETLFTLINHGITLNENQITKIKKLESESNTDSLMFYAAKYGLPEELKKIKDLKFQNNQGKKPLLVTAILHKQPDVCQYICEQPKITCDDINNAFEITREINNKDIIKILYHSLIKKNATQEQKNLFFANALRFISNDDFEEIFKLFNQEESFRLFILSNISKSENIALNFRIIDNLGINVGIGKSLSLPFWQYLINEYNPEILESIIQISNRIKGLSVYELMYSALKKPRYDYLIRLNDSIHFCIKHGQKNTLESILNCTIKPDDVSSDFTTAIEKGYVYSVAFLLKQSIDANNCESLINIILKNKPLENIPRIFDAFYNMYNENELEKLISKLSSVSSKDIRTSRLNPSLFIQAVRNSNINLIEALLKHDKTTQFFNILEKETGNSVLHIAVKAGNIEMVKFLIQKGAYINAKNKNNELPLDIAEKIDRKDIVAVFENKPAIANNTQKIDKSDAELREKTDVINEEISKLSSEEQKQAVLAVYNNPLSVDTLLASMKVYPDALKYAHKNLQNNKRLQEISKIGDPNIRAHYLDSVREYITSPDGLRVNQEGTVTLRVQERIIKACKRLPNSDSLIEKINLNQKLTDLKYDAKELSRFLYADTLGNNVQVHYEMERVLEDILDRYIESQFMSKASPYDQIIEALPDLKLLTEQLVNLPEFKSIKDAFHNNPTNESKTHEMKDLLERYKRNGDDNNVNNTVVIPTSK